MDQEHLVDGSWAPSLPSRQWNTHDLLGDVGTYTTNDAANVLYYLWENYGEDVEDVFLSLLQVGIEVGIDDVEDRRRLLRIFLKYPARPQLQFGAYAEPDRILNQVWSVWAVQIEEIYTDLKDTLGRSVRIPKPYPGSSRSGAEGAPGNVKAKIRRDLSAPDSWLCFLMGVLDTNSKHSHRSALKLELGVAGETLEDLLAGIREMDIASPTRLEDLMANLGLDQTKSSSAAEPRTQA